MVESVIFVFSLYLYREVVHVWLGLGGMFMFNIL